MKFQQLALFAAALMSAATAIFPTLNNNNNVATPKVIDDLSFLPPDAAETLEEACKDTAWQMKQAKAPALSLISVKEEGSLVMCIVSCARECFKWLGAIMSMRNKWMASPPFHH